MLLRNNTTCKTVCYRSDRVFLGYQIANSNHVRTINNCKIDGNSRYTHYVAPLINITSGQTPMSQTDRLGGYVQLMLLIAYPSMEVYHLKQNDLWFNHASNMSKTMKYLVKHSFKIRQTNSKPVFFIYQCEQQLAL